MRIVYDAFAKSEVSNPTLNEYLETGPPLKNLLRNILIRNCLLLVDLCGHIKQAFLQMHIEEDDRDAIHFHWLIDKDPNQIETYQFTRALFGLVKLPFILGGALTTHIGGCKERYQIEVDGILRSLS